MKNCSVDTDTIRICGLSPTFDQQPAQILRFIQTNWWMMKHVKIQPLHNISTVIEPISFCMCLETCHMTGVKGQHVLICHPASWRRRGGDRWRQPKLPGLNLHPPLPLCRLAIRTEYGNLGRVGRPVDRSIQIESRPAPSSLSFFFFFSTSVCWLLSDRFL